MPAHGPSAAGLLLSALGRAALAAPRELLRAVRLTRMLVRGRRIAARLESGGAPIRLDLGCGARGREGFVGVDTEPTAELPWDIRWGLPFGDGTVAEIRSDHFLEHLELPEVVRVLRECRRVLAPGGALEFSVPHADPYLGALARRDLEFLKAKIPDVPSGQEDLYATPFDRVAWLLARSGEHRSLFDRESIVAKVRLSGFEDVVAREPDPDRDGRPRFSSLYVVARKSCAG